MGSGTGVGIFFSYFSFVSSSRAKNFNYIQLKNLNNINMVL